MMSGPISVTVTAIDLNVPVKQSFDHDYVPDSVTAPVEIQPVRPPSADYVAHFLLNCPVSLRQFFVIEPAPAWHREMQKIGYFVVQQGCG